MSDPWALAAIFTALAMGGFLKGAIGLGAPVLAVPVMSAIFDVPTAIVLMVLPNIMINAWQLWLHYHRIAGQSLFLKYALGSGVGTFLGTLILVRTPGAFLSLGVATAVIAFIALRLSRPTWQLQPDTARKLAVPVGTVAGLLQGGAGVSAPAMVSFFNAMRLERLEFIPAVSTTFITMGLVQLPLMIWLGLMTPPLALTSLLALIPLLAFMPVGAWVARRVSAKAFDRAMLIILSLLAFELIWDALK